MKDGNSAQTRAQPLATTAMPMVSVASMGRLVSTAQGVSGFASKFSSRAGAASAAAVDAVIKAKEAAAGAASQATAAAAGAASQATAAAAGAASQATAAAAGAASQATAAAVGAASQATAAAVGAASQATAAAVGAASQARQSDKWDVDVGPLFISSQGMQLKPQCCVGLTLGNLSVGAGMDDLRGGQGFKCGARAEVAQELIGSGDSLVAFFQSLKAKRGLADDKVNALLARVHIIVAIVIQRIKVNIGGQCKVDGKMTLKLGVGMGAAVSLGWQDHEGYRMVGVGGGVEAIAVDLMFSVFVGIKDRNPDDLNPFDCDLNDLKLILEASTFKVEAKILLPKKHKTLSTNGAPSQASVLLLDSSAFLIDGDRPIGLTAEEEASLRTLQKAAEEAAAEEAAAGQAAAEKAAEEAAAAEKAAAEMAAAEEAAAEAAAAEDAMAAQRAAAEAEAEKAMAVAMEAAMVAAMAEALKMRKAVADKEAAEKVVAEKAAVEKAASEKAASEKAASEKEASEKEASETEASEKEASDKEAAAKDAAAAAGADREQCEPLSLHTSTDEGAVKFEPLALEAAPNDVLCPGPPLPIADPPSVSPG